MRQLSSILEMEVFHNSILSYLMCAGVFLLLLFSLKILQWAVFRRLKDWAAKTPGKTDDFIIALVEKSIIPLLYLGALYFAVSQLNLSHTIDRVVNAVSVSILTFQIIQLILAISIYLLERTWLKQENQKSGSAVSKSVLTLAKLAVWSIGVIFVFDNLGFNVSAVVAGLGIGGVAVALAAQTILGDLFNYFVIFFDRPFEEGDFIVFDDFMGEIENIGIKSTRIRALGGEQIVISNSNLTGSKIRNYKRMAQRRILFSLGVTYETELEKLKKIPAIIRAIIESQKAARFDRAHFKKFSDYSLDFEIVYFVLGREYNQYMDIQQDINLAIKEIFEKEGIEFAYPTAVEYQKELKD